MSSEIATLMSRIEPDPWRSKTGFSSEMRAALDVTLNSKSVAEIESALNAWIRTRTQLDEKDNCMAGL